MEQGVTLRKKRTRYIAATAATVMLLVGVAAAYAKLFGPVDVFAGTDDFYIEGDMSVTDIAAALTEKGYVRDAWIFDIVYARKAYGNKILPGGYKLSKNMDAWTIAGTLLEQPYSAWIKVPVGVRKEQIADLLADRLGWSDDKKQAFLTATEANGASYIEGVYYPDTYFIPSDLLPAQVEALMRARFSAAFEPYSREATAKGVPWPTVLTIASLIQREAGSASDMYIISGIIQNRLRAHMPLALDATLQYMSGSEDGGWWAPPQKAGTYPDSPFNTYKHAGLPPHAIAEPSLTAIDAALNPASTNCLFYIHDTRGVMHCSATFSQHQAYINKYLK